MTLDYAPQTSPAYDDIGDTRSLTDSGTPSRFGEGKASLSEPGERPDCLRERPSAATGPRTPEGKEMSSRNAVTHGLFARETVLTQHGEDPAEYRSLLEELTLDLRPQNLLERHCVQTIAAALWRLRRFHQWNAQLDTNDELAFVEEQLRQLDPSEGNAPPTPPLLGAGGLSGAAGLSQMSQIRAARARHKQRRR